MNRQSKRAKLTRKPSKTSPFFPIIATEIFIQICFHLPAPDLFSLERVCKIFHEYLNSNESGSTQLIWKQCRETHMPIWNIPAPLGWTERKYVKFLVLKDHCQFCGAKEQRYHGVITNFE